MTNLDHPPVPETFNVNGIPHYFVVCPEWGNEGEDMSWIRYYILGHPDVGATVDSTMSALCSAFTQQVITPDPDAWDDMISDGDGHEAASNAFVAWLQALDPRWVAFATTRRGIRWLG